MSDGTNIWGPGPILPVSLLGRKQIIDLRDYGQRLDGNTPNDTALAAWLVDLVKYGAIGTWVGTILSQQPFLFPTLGILDANTYIGGGIQIIGHGRDKSLWLYQGAANTFCIDDECLTSDPGHYGPRSGVVLSNFRMLGSLGPTKSLAAGGIRLVNPRQAVLSMLQIDSFYSGAGLCIYGAPKGDAEYCAIRDSFFGFWHINSTLVAPAGRSPARIGQDDFLWNRYGILCSGAEDGNGKVNENLFDNNNFYNCWDSAIALTGYDGDGNPGVPNPNQPGVFGGAAVNQIGRNSIYSGQTRQLFQGVVHSASNNVGGGFCSIVLGDATEAATYGVGYVEYTQTVPFIDGSAKDGYYVDANKNIYASFQTGVADGLRAPVAGYNAGTRTIILNGNFPGASIPALGDIIVIGYRSNGVDINSAGGQTLVGVKTEQVTNPIRIRAMAGLGLGSSANNISIYGGLLSNSGGNGICIDSSQGPFTATAGAAGVILGPNTMIPLEDHYKDQLAVILSGTGAGQVFKVAHFSGAPLYILTITAVDWAHTAFDAGNAPIGVVPNATSVFNFIQGPIPFVFSPQIRIIDTAPDTTTGVGDCNVILDSVTFVSRYTKHPKNTVDTSTQVGPFIQAINNSTHTIQSGDVLRLGTGVDDYKDTQLANCDFPVAIGGALGTEKYPNGSSMPIGIPGARVLVTMVDGTAVVGDTIVSTADNKGTVNNAPPNQKCYLGTAISGAFLSASLGRYVCHVAIGSWGGV